jgi:predicted nucleic acid-binding protein
MNHNPKVYLDTSALFSGIWSDTGGARLVLKLGEAGVVRLLVGSIVLSEIEIVIRSKALELLGVLALVLDRSNIQVVRSTSPETHQHILTFLQHTGDAHVLAAAWDKEVDYFVTLDRKHYIGNEPLKDVVPCVMGTPGDFLTWYRTNLF